ncbi:MAG TPA: hypothetical protein VI548_09855 [Chitinophagaceae bacterium]|nr:hypothetical protein [Chitinophagaceae bacterium]
MKKIVSVLSLTAAIIFTSCFDIFEESTINDDGSGIYTHTSDMSSMWAMLKMMGGEDTDSLGKMKIDTVISIVSFKDSIPGITETEKKLIEEATMRILMNASEEIFQVIFRFPFSNPPDLKNITELIKKIDEKSINTAMGNVVSGEEAEDNPNQTGGIGFKKADPEEYYVFEIEKGKISSKLNKEKYARIADDLGLNSLMEMSKMGYPMNFVTVYNLPQPVKKAEGKGIKISADKKKVTIEASLDDFLENPEKFEYEIEY